PGMTALGAPGFAERQKAQAGATFAEQHGCELNAPLDQVEQPRARLGGRIVRERMSFEIRVDQEDALAPSGRGERKIESNRGLALRRRGRRHQNGASAPVAIALDKGIVK